MAVKEPDTALLEIDDVAGRMDEATRESFYVALFKALEQTRRFALLPPTDLPEVPPHAAEEEPQALIEAFAPLTSVTQVVLARFEPATSPLTARASWRASLLLYDVRDGRRLALREVWLDRGAPPEEVRWAAYEFAEPERFAELARGHRLADLAKEPERLKRDPEYLSTLLLSHLQRASWDAAVGDAQALLDVAPEDASGWHGKALALLRTRRLPEAAAAVERELTLRPTSEGWILKGDIQEAEGRPAQAVESYRAAVQLEGADGARAHAKLAALERLLGEVDALEILRMGWMWGYLHYVGVMLKSDLSEELQTHLKTVGSELESEFRDLTGIHLARLIGLDRWNAWVRALNARDPKAYREASEACFGSRETLAGVVDCLPGALRRWLGLGRELFWIQAVFYASAQHWDTVGADNPPRGEEEALAREAETLAADAELEKTKPALTELGRRLRAVAARPTSKEKLDETVALIEQFRRALFEDLPD